MNLTVIGGGPGGYVAAIRAAQLGATVTLIEREKIGGTCLNIGCVPTKCLLHNAELLHEINNRGEEIGLKIKGAEVDFPRLIAHKNDVCGRLTGGVASLLRMNKVKVVTGEVEFASSRRIKIKKGGGEEISTPDKIIIATGSVVAIPPIPGLKNNPACIDSTDALNLTALPKSMAIIGGGVIGMEMACVFASLGTKVTVVEALDRVLPTVDGEISALSAGAMKKSGVEIFTSCPVQSVEMTKGGARLVCKDKQGATVKIEAEKILVAAGRKANTASLKLDAAGIKNDRGAIIVNEKMETSVAGVYAVGDCVKGYAQLAHAASAMGEIAAENCCGKNSVYDESTCPSCVYVIPEIASVGLTEEECRERNIPYKVGRFPMSANGKALIVNGGEGLVKIVAGKKYGEILGLQIAGPRAGDLIAEGALAIRVEATLDELITTIHSHPTVTEAVREAALQAEKRAIHTRN